MAKFLFLTVMTTGTLFTLHNGSLQDKYVDSRPSASPKRLAKKSVAANVPSDFDKESAMSPKELMDRWNPLIAVASRRFGISESWIRAVTRMESGGRTMQEENQPITSSPGAMGLMQVMPGTYREMREQYRLGANAYDPQDNVLAGTAYLRWLYQKYGYPAMFAGYNAGPGKLDDHLQRGRPLPTETSAYVRGITNILGVRPGRRIRPSPTLASLMQPASSPI
ncbi:MAG TPA: lytic transglycosylase domain-containing protein [Rhizomicrobium sp.]